MLCLINEPIHILGAGGIGTVLAWSLARTGYFCDPNVVDPNKVVNGRKKGTTVVGRGTQQITLVTFDDWTPPANALFYSAPRSVLSNGSFDRCSTLILLLIQ